MAKEGGNAKEEPSSPISNASAVSLYQSGMKFDLLKDEYVNILKVEKQIALELWNSLISEGKLRPSDKIPNTYTQNLKGVIDLMRNDVVKKFSQDDKDFARKQLLFILTKFHHLTRSRQNVAIVNQ